MESQNQTYSGDYLAPDIAESARERGGGYNDPSAKPKF